MLSGDAQARPADLCGFVVMVAKVDLYDLIVPSHKFLNEVLQVMPASPFRYGLHRYKFHVLFLLSNMDSSIKGVAVPAISN